MGTDRDQRAYELFEAVLEREAADRPEFLDRACAGDEALRAEVQSLLAADTQAGEFLEPQPRDQESAPTSDRSALDRVGTKLGRYQIRRVIASGGMGTVYEAVQEHPRRIVALKALKRGIASRSALRRFEHESQILARLRHPGIAQVYEADTYDDGTGVVPYFAMEYVPGAKPITRYANDKGLGTRERLSLFAEVCDAVHHGHQKGIIHRDLKPGNLLVNSSGQVKIIDFGVARSTDADVAVTTLQTDIGQLIGTLQYMSPEQCAGDPQDIDTRSDVYALGVVLYELLCGKPPYDVAHKGIHEATSVICDHRPAKPSTVKRALRGDVETIVLKALEKHRERRYRSAAELEEDIKRYLRNDPIIARPPSLVYHLRVFARRNTVLCGAVAALFTMLVAGVIVSASLYVRAERARAEAEAVSEFLNNDLLTSASPAKEPNRELTVRQVLDQASEGIGRKFESQPLVEASIRMTLGNTYRTLGEYKQAESHLKRALQLRQIQLGETHPDTLTSMDKLGGVYARLCRYDEAGVLWERTLEVRRRVLGEEHPDTLESMDNLAGFYYKKGRCGEAEPLWLRTLELRRRLLGDRHEDTLVTLSNLAHLYASQGRYEESQPLWARTLELRLQTIGREHPDTLYSMGHLATLYSDMGRYDDAEALWLPALELHYRVLGEDHPDTLESVAGYGATLLGKGDLEKAEAMLRIAVQKLLDALGEDHEKVGIARSNLGACLFAMGRHAEAEEQLLKALPMLKLALGADHRQTIKTVERLVSLYGTWGKPDQAAMYRAMLPRPGNNSAGR